MKLVHEPVDSSDYKYWSRSLEECSIEDLMRGLKASNDWPGFLTLGDFRRLCEKPKQEACHNPHVSLPHHYLPRKEAKDRMKAIREEVGI